MLHKIIDFIDDNFWHSLLKEKNKKKPNEICTIACHLIG